TADGGRRAAAWPDRRASVFRRVSTVVRAACRCVFRRAAAIRQPRVGGAQSAGREEERVRAGREDAEPA
ncbi:hypothetical protein, partial [Burkholderia pseudomallei]|uniref:hypothetical protein n=1 Tax=Burkholderia pseudomallei TaxID=28450 RepID=UPI001E563DF0